MHTLDSYARAIGAGVLAAGLAMLGGCADPNTSAPTPSTEAEGDNANAGTEALPRRFPAESLEMPADVIVADPAANATRSAFFGDLHVHTTYSFDAFAFGTVATPDDAYRFAEGEAIEHPAGFEVKLRAPLDFYAVTDHAQFLGGVAAAADPSTDFSQLPHAQNLHNLNVRENRTADGLVERVTAFRGFIPQTRAGLADGSIDVDMVNQVAKNAWADIVGAAQRHNRPGSFTTFVAYEYTSSADDRGNLHRNVIFRDADKLPAMPFSRHHSQNPEGLWDWMDGLRAQGIETLAIPHNSNGSNGQMFKMVDWAGDPLDDSYAAQRIRNEPLVEVTQIKGTSETHPMLSDNDEWADFELMPYRIGTSLPSQPSGSYAREALLNGLTLRDRGIANAYQFGFIGASDNHTAASPVEEDTYFGKVGILDSRGDLRGSVPLAPDVAALVAEAGRLRVEETDGKPYATGGYETWSASGLTGVWAEENTRDALYRAFRRKETFATSGPRMKVRMFGGYDFEAPMLTQADMLTQAYASGVSMGGELLAQDGGVPTFIAWATRDPNSASLQRLQIIKGWTVEGEHHEQVYDVACSDGGTVDPSTHRCPDNGASVDLSDCSITTGVGAGELKTVWRDPDFNPEHRAFYYVRALENPTCRWSTWDAVRAGVPPRPELKSTLQERVWSSPIWYVPADD
jgi:hypothetical protein